MRPPQAQRRHERSACQTPPTLPGAVKSRHVQAHGVLVQVRGRGLMVAIEFARKALLSEVRPTFYEVEEAVSALPALNS